MRLCIPNLHISFFSRVMPIVSLMLVSKKLPVHKYQLIPMRESLMAPNDNFHEAFSANPRFRNLVRKKRKISFILFGLTMALFFSIPVISSYFPELFKKPFIGKMNVGLAYLLLQYIAGAAVAWKYAKSFGEIDKETSTLVSEFIRKS